MNERVGSDRRRGRAERVGNHESGAIEQIGAIEHPRINSLGSYASFSTTCTYLYGPRAGLVLHALQLVGAFRQCGQRVLGRFTGTHTEGGGDSR